MWNEHVSNVHNKNRYMKEMYEIAYFINIYLNSCELWNIGRTRAIRHGWNCVKVVMQAKPSISKWQRSFEMQYTSPNVISYETFCFSSEFSSISYFEIVLWSFFLKSTKLFNKIFDEIDVSLLLSIKRHDIYQKQDFV